MDSTSNNVSKQLDTFVKSEEQMSTIDLSLNVTKLLAAITPTTESVTIDYQTLMLATSATVGINQSLDASHIDSYVVCHNRSLLQFTNSQQLSLQVRP